MNKRIFSPVELIQNLLGGKSTPPKKDIQLVMAGSPPAFPGQEISRIHRMHGLRHSAPIIILSPFKESPSHNTLYETLLANNPFQGPRYGDGLSIKDKLFQLLESLANPHDSADLLESDRKFLLYMKRYESFQNKRRKIQLDRRQKDQILYIWEYMWGDLETAGKTLNPNYPPMPAEDTQKPEALPFSQNGLSIKDKMFELIDCLENPEDAQDLTPWELRFIKNLKKDFNGYRDNRKAIHKYLTRNMKNKILEIWDYMWGAEENE